MENNNRDAVFNSRDGINESVWQKYASASATRQDKYTVSSEQVYDCLIVGAGITGVTTGLILQRAGLVCVIAEAEHSGFGTTGGTTAHLNTFFDATYPEIESDFGQEESKLVARSGLEAFDIIEGFIKEFDLDCDFEFKSAWLYAENQKEAKQLQEILEASKRAGITVEMTDHNVVPVPFESIVSFSGQGQFHPLKYIQGLLEEFIALGGVILENTLIRTSDFEDGVYTAKSDERTIKAKKLVYSTHIPPGVNMMSMRNAPYRSYVLGLKLNDDNYPIGLAYDMQEPYHYFRTHVIEGQSYLIVGGEDHKTGHGDPELAFKELEKYVRQYYDVATVDYRWSGQYYVPVDGLPYIGKLPGAEDGTYIATGFNGNGMMFGTLSAKIIADLVLGKDNVYATLFSPSRMKPVAGFTEFIKENADVAWHFITDRFSSEELQTFNDLGKSEGKLVKYQGKQLAVYKDKLGKITALNPTCTHAGCTVQFNPSENSWDCPCHGGRFDISGRVLTGPPTEDLEVVVIINAL